MSKPRNWNRDLAKARHDKKDALQRAMFAYAEKLEADMLREYWADERNKSMALEYAERLRHTSQALVTAEEAYKKAVRHYEDLERAYNSERALEGLLFGGI